MGNPNGLNDGNFRYLMFLLLLKPSLRYDSPLIPPNLASRPIRDEER